MDYQELIDRLDPALVQRMRDAVATGRWPDGTAVTEEQREHSLQAIIAWEAKHLLAQERTGYIDRGRKEQAYQALRWADSGTTAEDDQ